MIAVIAGLNVFPLKSAGAVALTEAEPTPDGLRHDREFMLVRPDGRHLSQREVVLSARSPPSARAGAQSRGTRRSRQARTT